MDNRRQLIALLIGHVVLASLVTSLNVECALAQRVIGKSAGGAGAGGLGAEAAHGITVFIVLVALAYMGMATFGVIADHYGHRNNKLFGFLPLLAGMGFPAVAWFCFRPAVDWIADGFFSTVALIAVSGLLPPLVEDMFRQK